MRIFSSGSCRLLTAINNGYNKVKPIHSMFYNFVGVNFLGKLHNIKQHIQFIKFIQDEIVLPDHILPKFLTSYNDFICNCKCEDMSLLLTKKDNIKRDLNECDWYIFEICSLKIYERDGYQVQVELDKENNYVTQTSEDLYNDLVELRNMIPLHKKILFQVHFRPNIIDNVTTSCKAIESREIIYNVIKKFTDSIENTFIYDPSIIIKNNIDLYDGAIHFTKLGLQESFNYIYDNYLRYNNYIDNYNKRLPKFLCYVNI